MLFFFFFFEGDCKTTRTMMLETVDKMIVEKFFDVMLTKINSGLCTQSVREEGRKGRNKHTNAHHTGLR